MQIANDVTLAALASVHTRFQAGMRSADIAALMDEATLALGGAPEFSLVLLDEASRLSPRLAPSRRRRARARPC